MNEEHDKLTVKELAVAIGHHTSFVYSMRTAGFSMVNGLATKKEAELWLLSSGFRMVKGRTYLGPMVTGPLARAHREGLKRQGNGEQPE